MQSINKTIESFLVKHNLNKPELTYIVAFSGGYDSMCLLYSLKQIAPKNKIVAIHLNHKWRGVESDNEELNCKNFCKSINVEFYSESLSSDIAHTETAARDARYKFFETCAKKYNTEIIFTAHNKNDNAETIIYRICKGTGINGLQGISAKRDCFYRPLLTIERKDIENYCHTNKLNPNIDSSNSNTKYKRNYIRAEVLPKLEKVNPNAIEMINSLSEIANEETQIIEEYLSYVNQKISENGVILTKKFLNLSEVIQKKLIYNLFIQNKLEYDRKKITNILEFIKENVNSRSGKTCSLSENLWIYTSEKFIKIIDNNKPETTYLHITKTGKYKINDYIFEIEKFDKEVKKYPKDSENVAYVDLSGLEFDFELRQRQAGDVIIPLGSVGSQKLKKYLNNKKIPNHEKDSLLFFAQEKEILWAAGLGISDKIKVQKRPTHRLKLYK